MISINKVCILGHVGADPEVRYLSEGNSYARFRVATSESYTNKNGERITNTEWHNVVAWRELAKRVELYIRKGGEVYVEGKITYRSFEKNGETRFFTEIVADNLRLGRRPDGGVEPQVPQSAQPGQASPQPAYTQQPVAPQLASEPQQAYEIPTSPADDLPF